MAAGMKSDNKMPPGRKPLGMHTNATGIYDDGQVVDRTPAGRRSFSEGKNTGGEGAKPTVIRPGTYPDGKPIMGTPAEHVHGKVSTGYNDPAAHQYRAELRGHTSTKGHNNHG